MEKLLIWDKDILGIKYSLLPPKCKVTIEANPDGAGGINNPQMKVTIYCEKFRIEDE